MTYRPRVVDSELAERLKATGAVVIEGPRACGKTTTARQIAASEARLDVDDVARRLASLEPARVLIGDVPRLIDEWQLEPAIWNHVRRAVDDRGLPGQFILTGSTVPADDATRHTGAGRLTRLRMRPFSLFELGRSSGQVSLAGLLDGGRVAADRSVIPLDDLAELICVGGWPLNLQSTTQTALRANRDHLDEIRRLDITNGDGRRRDPVRVGMLLRSLARNVATPAATATLASDTGEGVSAIKEHTAAEYLRALERIMIVENQPAWPTHLRSRSVLRSKPIRHLADPSLAVAAVRATPARLLRDLGFLGFLFESLVVRDLRVYAQATDAEVFHYREKAGLEVDAIVQCNDGRWAAFEVKLGEGSADEGADNLLRLARKVDPDRMGEPTSLGVIVSSGYGYTREDGVSVIPVGALGP
ncbi:ATP-binding protein [Candidatus Palauibacter sp.]|uniref:ATP-binding protein n=1 Tax=Candidatus Palauibacter sp. TaxID=3101350 RepID=UPI003B52DB82